MIWVRRRLRNAVRLLNRATGKQVGVASVEAIVDSHARPARFARILARVLEFEAEPDRHTSARSRRGQRKYNHLCDYAAAQLVSRALALFFDRYDLTGLPGYRAAFVQKTGADLDKDGCSFIEAFVKAADCERIVDFLAGEEIAFREDLTGRVHCGYSAESLAATTSNVSRIVDQSALLKCPEIASLVFDPNLLAIAQQFLGAPPIHTQTNCWWSVAYSSEAEYLKAAAQKFHQDRDYIKFVKMFFYLTDVGADNGPHEFIAGSNADYAVHSSNRRRSSKRLDDGQLESGYADDRFRRFTGPRGSLIVEDTSGFHKGAPVRAGHRLMLQLEHVSSLYASPPAYLARSAIEYADPSIRQLSRLFAAYRRA
jgi:Phytanoyl-CoA dioxygenase (PhyH)